MRDWVDGRTIFLIIRPLTLLMVTKTTTHTLEEIEEEVKEALVAKAAGVKEVAETTLQSPNCWKSNSNTLDLSCTPSAQETRWQLFEIHSQ